MRKSTGQRKIVALWARKTAYKRKMSRARNFPLLDSRMVSMGVLSDDFATVDLREDYANLSLPKEANSRGKRNGKTNEKKGSHGGKSGSRSPSGSAGTAPLRRAFRFGFPRCSCCRFAACAWLRRAQRAALVYAKHTPRCQMG